MRRKNYSLKLSAKRGTNSTNKTCKRNQKGGDLQDIHVFINQNDVKSLTNCSNELMITNIINDGNGTKSGNSIQKIIRIDNNELTDFGKCISILRSILTQLICQTSVVNLLAEGTKNDEHYRTIWSFIHPNKEEDKKKDTDRLPRVINDYQSLIQFIRVMRLVLCKPSDIVKGRLLGAEKLSKEAQSYITGTLAPAVFSICGKTTGLSNASANKPDPKTSTSGQSPSSTNMTSMMNAVSRTMPSSMSSMNVNNMGLFKTH